MSKHHSRLPHWHRPGTAIFLTWRLAGSMPLSRVADLYSSEGAKFVAFDRLLDARATGPKWLGQPEVARAVSRVILAGQEGGYYELGSWVIMPNHVHLLIYPLVDLPRIVFGVKHKSAKVANPILNRTGAFWSRDYFDRWVRNRDEERRIIHYIESNPVKAGLCDAATDWPYSSANKRA